MGSALAALAVGCGPLGSSVPTGELGNGQFVYECPAGNVDPGCAGGGGVPEASIDFEDEAAAYEDSTDSGGSGTDGGTTTFPSVIAVGAVFSVAYTALGQPSDIQGDTGYSVTPASPRLALPSGNALLALRPGYEALLAATDGVSEVDDFVFVRFANIASLTASQSLVSVAVGGTQVLSVTAQDAAQELLAGRLRCAWSVESGSDFVVVQGSTVEAAVTIQGAALGDARLKATCGPASAEVLVHVVVAIEDGGPGDGGRDSGGGDGAAGDASKGEASVDAGHGDAAEDGGHHG